MITLEPHVGRMKRRTAAGIEVDANVQLDQFQIMLDGKRVGYVGKKSGSPINLIGRLGQEQQDAIRQFVAEHIGGQSTVHMPPPAPVRVEADEPEDEDEEDADGEE